MLASALPRGAKRLRQQLIYLPGQSTTIRHKALDRNSPSRLPPLNTLPNSLARRPNGVSSQSISPATSLAFGDPSHPEPRPPRSPCRRSETRLAREQSASDSLAARVCRWRRAVMDEWGVDRRVGGDTPDGDSGGVGKPDSDTAPPPHPLNLITSSRTSSSHRLSLSPSDARTRISSA